MTVHVAVTLRRQTREHETACQYLQLQLHWTFSIFSSTWSWRAVVDDGEK